MQVGFLVCALVKRSHNNGQLNLSLKGLPMVKSTSKPRDVIKPKKPSHKFSKNAAANHKSSAWYQEAHRVFSMAKPEIEGVLAPGIYLSRKSGKYR